jgi:hypothetical protein
MTDTTTPLPPVVDRDTWTAQVNELRVREPTPARATRSPPPGSVPQDAVDRLIADPERLEGAGTERPGTKALSPV